MREECIEAWERPPNERVEPTARDSADTERVRLQVGLEAIGVVGGEVLAAPYRRLSSSVRRRTFVASGGLQGNGREVSLVIFGSVR